MPAETAAESPPAPHFVTPLKVRTWLHNLGARYGTLGMHALCTYNRLLVESIDAQTRMILVPVAKLSAACKSAAIECPGGTDALT